MADLALQPMTVDQFFNWQSDDERSYELIDGQAVAMAPTLRAHALIAANLVQRLGEPLRKRDGCSVQIEACVEAGEDNLYIADIVVSCTQHQPGQRATPDPILIVEILSPSTEKHDRVTKVPDYRALPSVREIVLIDQDRLYCEVHRRLDDDRWLTDLLRTAEAPLRLESCGFEEPLGEIYAHVAFEE